MSNRIRYVSERPDSNLTLVSLRAFNANGVDYKVRLHSADLAYEVVDATTQAVVEAGGGVSLSNLKIKAKKALAKLGVTFAEEKRVKVKSTPATE